MHSSAVTFLINLHVWTCDFYLEPCSVERDYIDCDFFYQSICILMNKTCLKLTWNKKGKINYDFEHVYAADKKVKCN